MCWIIQIFCSACVAAPWWNKIEYFSFKHNLHFLRRGWKCLLWIHFAILNWILCFFLLISKCGQIKLLSSRFLSPLNCGCVHSTPAWRCCLSDLCRSQQSCSHLWLCSKLFFEGLAWFCKKFSHCFYWPLLPVGDLKGSIFSQSVSLTQYVVLCVCLSVCLPVPVRFRVDSQRCS